MKISSMKMPAFIRAVREAEGISQKDLAAKIQITPSAITQYEKSTASISKDKLLAMAPILNLNPHFVDNGIGNPFKTASPKGIVRMYFPLKPDGSIDMFSILQVISDYNSHAIFLFLKPARSIEQKSLQIKRWQGKGLTSYALLLKDSDDNIFLFKRKDDVFFNEKIFIAEVEHDAIMDHKVFDLDITSVDETTFNQIKEWNIKKNRLETILAPFQSASTRFFFLELLKQIKLHDHRMTEEEYTKAREFIESDKRLRDSIILSDLMPKISDLLKKQIPFDEM